MGFHLGTLHPPSLYGAPPSSCLRAFHLGPQTTLQPRTLPSAPFPQWGPSAQTPRPPPPPRPLPGPLQPLPALINPRPQPGDTRRAAQGTVVGQTLRFRFSLFKGPQMSVAHCCLGPGLFPRMHVGPQCVMCPHFPLCPLPFNPVAHTPAPLQPSSLPCTPVFLDSINHVL